MVNRHVQHEVQYDHHDLQAGESVQRAVAVCWWICVRFRQIGPRYQLMLLYCIERFDLGVSAIEHNVSSVVEESSTMDLVPVKFARKVLNLSNCIICQLDMKDTEHTCELTLEPGVVGEETRGLVTIGTGVRAYPKMEMKNKSAHFARGWLSCILGTFRGEHQYFPLLQG